MVEVEKKKRDKVVSYSQYAVFSGCPQRYKLEKIDRIGGYESNIHLVFGSAIHETIQDFLEIKKFENLSLRKNYIPDSLIITDKNQWENRSIILFSSASNLRMPSACCFKFKSPPSNRATTL